MTPTTLLPSGRFLVTPAGEKVIEFARGLTGDALRVAKARSLAVFAGQGDPLGAQARGRRVYAGNVLVCEVVIEGETQANAMARLLAGD